MRRLSRDGAQIERALYRARGGARLGRGDRLADAALAYPQRADAADARSRLRQGLPLRPRGRRCLFRSGLFSGRGRAPRILPAQRARLRTRSKEAARLLGAVAAAPQECRGMSSAVKTEHVAEADGAIRLDRWFRRHYPTLGHGALEKLLRTGQVRVDGRRAKAADRLVPGQAIRVPPLGEEAAAAPQAPRPVRPQDAAMLRGAVLYRDDDLIVLDKPVGLAVQGGSGNERHLDGLLDALRFGAGERPRLVHRLDKETSGVLVIARTARAAAFLARAFRARATRKLYWALAAGLPKPPQGRIDLALVKLPGPS